MTTQEALEALLVATMRGIPDYDALAKIVMGNGDTAYAFLTVGGPWTGECWIKPDPTSDHAGGWQDAKPEWAWTRGVLAAIEAVNMPFAEMLVRGVIETLDGPSYDL